MVVNRTWALWIVLPVLLLFLKMGWTMAFHPRAVQEKAIRQVRGRPMPNVPEWLAPRPDSDAFLRHTRLRGIFGIVVSGGATLLLVAALIDSWLRR